jgi:hypothetical protein
MQAIAPWGPVRLSAASSPSSSLFCAWVEVPSAVARVTTGLFSWCAWNVCDASRLTQGAEREESRCGWRHGDDGMLLRVRSESWLKLEEKVVGSLRRGYFGISKLQYLYMQPLIV